MKTNDLNQAVEDRIQSLLNQTGNYVQREPLGALAAAFGAGVLCTRMPFRPLAALALKLTPPLLFGMGVLKVMDLCSQQRPRPTDGGRVQPET